MNINLSLLYYVNFYFYFLIFFKLYFFIYLILSFYAPLKNIFEFQKKRLIALPKKNFHLFKITIKNIEIMENLASNCALPLKKNEFLRRGEQKDRTR